MALQWFMILFGWLAVLLFVTVASYKIARLARLPLGLRWEVYPVPGETGEKRAYGGSYMEELDWTKQPRSGQLLPEWVEIGKEVFTLKRVREHNRYGIWPLSLAMHYGLYLYFVWLALLALDSLINLPALAGVITIVGLVSFLLGLCGSLALILRRATCPDLRHYTAPLDYFNLAFIAAFFALGLVSWLAASSFVSHQTYIGSALRFQPAAVPLPTLAAFFVFELFMIYMPFTKLLHYFAKYLTFHHALWDDRFSSKGSPFDRRVKEQLTFPVSWSGPHIVPGKTWLEEVQLAAAGGEKK